MSDPRATFIAAYAHMQLTKRKKTLLNPRGATADLRERRGAPPLTSPMAGRRQPQSRAREGAELRCSRPMDGQADGTEALSWLGRFVALEWPEILGRCAAFAVGASTLAALIMMCLSSMRAKRMAQRVAAWVPPEARQGAAAPFLRAGAHVAVLLNPFGGGGYAMGRFHDVVAPMLRAARIQFDLLVTERRGHARELAAGLRDGTAARRYDAVVVLGGDGFVHEVVNGLTTGCGRDVGKARAALQRLPILALPGGTSNGLVASLGMVDIVDSVDQALSATAPRAVDLYSIDYPGHEDRESTLWDAHVFSWALIADHDQLVEHTLRWMPKSLREIAAPLIAIGRLRSYPGRVTLQPARMSDAEREKVFYSNAGELPLLDGEPPAPSVFGGRTTAAFGSDGPVGEQEPWRVIDSEFLVLSVANCPQGSYDAVIAPGAKIDDGLIDLLVVRRGTSRLQLLIQFMKMESGDFASLPYVELYKCSRVCIEPRGCETMTASGEALQGGSQAACLTAHRGVAYFVA